MQDGGAIERGGVLRGGVRSSQKIPNIKNFFLLLMKSQRVANVVVEYYSCATSARWLGGGVCTTGRVVGEAWGGEETGPSIGYGAGSF